MLIQVGRNGVYNNSNNEPCKRHGNVEITLPADAEAFAAELVAVAKKFNMSKMYTTIVLSAIGNEHFPKGRRDNVENEDFKALIEMLEKLQAKKKIIQMLNALEDKTPESAMNLLKLIDANLFAKVSEELAKVQA